jgi:hypothetical protein
MEGERERERKKIYIYIYVYTFPGVSRRAVQQRKINKNLSHEMASTVSPGGLNREKSVHFITRLSGARLLIVVHKIYYHFSIHDAVLKHGF